jgi:hypothetical protein
VVVDVCALPVLLLFFLSAVIVAMDKRVVVVLVCVPMAAVFPFIQRIVRMVVGHVVVVVSMRPRRMRMLGLTTVSLGDLAH